MAARFTCIAGRVAKAVLQEHRGCANMSAVKRIHTTDTDARINFIVLAAAKFTCEML
jgi:hypothetical protein